MLVLLAVPDFDSENLDYVKYSLSVRKRGAVLLSVTFIKMLLTMETYINNSLILILIAYIGVASP